MRKLYRNPQNKIVFGILSGLGEYLHTDPTVLRIAFVCLLIATGVFPFAVLYILGYFIIPEKPHPHIVDEQ